MKNKIKILRIIPTLNPAYGGPANAILDSSISLVKNGFKVDILTYDKKNSSYLKSKKINIFNMGPGYTNFKFSINLFLWLHKNKKNYDLFIIHGIWQFSTLISRILLKKKYFVFLHGGLDPFFKLNFLKKIKKKIYWLLIEKKNLLMSNSLLLTNTIEKNQLNNTFVNTSGIKKKVVNYGILEPKFNKKKSVNLFNKNFPSLKNKKFLLFLGRFHEKKGCDTLIKALNILLKKNIKINVLLAGPNNTFKDNLKNLSKKYGLEKNLFWSDTITNDLKWGAISSSSGMVLASNGENFGVALAESLSCSRPVLTTYKVNIYKEILKHKAGFVSKNSVNDFSKILEKFNNFNKVKKRQLSKNSLICFNKNFNLEYKNNILAKFLKKEA